MSEIVFSKKYKPLFDLLLAWEKVDELSHFGLSENESAELDALNQKLKTKKESSEPNAKKLTRKQLAKIKERVYDLSCKWLDSAQ
jgi:hypothetical protein